MNKRYRFNWIDKTGLGLSFVVMAIFLVLWLLLLLAAGSAPTGRLSALCLQWAMKALVEGLVPIWLVVRTTHAMLTRGVRVFSSANNPVPRIGEVPITRVVPSLELVQ